MNIIRHIKKNNPIRIVMMELIWITAVEVLEAYNLQLTFNNGVHKKFDFRQVLDKGQPMFEPLKDLAVFRDITLDGWTITWQNGSIDIAPEYLYEHGVAI